MTPTYVVPFVAFSREDGGIRFVRSGSPIEQIPLPLVVAGPCANRARGCKRTATIRLRIRRAPKAVEYCVRCGAQNCRRIAERWKSPPMVWRLSRGKWRRARWANSIVGGH
jgi:hypothetical protein